MLSSLINFGLSQSLAQLIRVFHKHLSIGGSTWCRRWREGQTTTSDGGGAGSLSGIRVFQITLRGGAGKFLETFSKVKTTFCKY